MESTTWYLLGTSGHYHFWFRNPYNNEKLMVYNCTPNAAAPETESGHYNLESLMKSKDVTEIDSPRSW